MARRRSSILPMALKDDTMKHAKMSWTLEFLDPQLEKDYVDHVGGEKMQKAVRSTMVMMVPTFSALSLVLLALDEQMAAAAMALATLGLDVPAILMVRYAQRTSIYWVSARVAHIVCLMIAHTVVLSFCKNEFVLNIAAAFLIDWLGIVLPNQKEFHAKHLPLCYTIGSLCYAFLLVWLPDNVTITMRVGLGVLFLMRTLTTFPDEVRQRRVNRIEFATASNLKKMNNYMSKRLSYITRENKQLNSSLEAAQSEINRVFNEGGSFLDTWSLSRADVEIGEGIGEGSYGTVHKGRLRKLRAGCTDWVDVALKTVRTTRISTRVIQEFMDEMSLMAPMSHPNIVLFLGGCWKDGPDKLCIVIEYCSEGSLRDFLRGDNSTCRWASPMHTIMIGVARGLKYLHHEVRGEAIIHRDIKPDNILLSEDKESKIADFGVSRRYDSKEAIVEGDPERLMMSKVGTPMYLAPETILGEPSNTKVDVYSFGMMLHEVASIWIFDASPMFLAHQFRMISQLRVAVDGWRPELPPLMQASQPKIYELILECYAQKARDRPTFVSIVRRLEGMEEESLRRASAPQLSQSAKVRRTSSGPASLDAARTNRGKTLECVNDYSKTPK